MNVRGDFNIVPKYSSSGYFAGDCRRINKHHYLYHFTTNGKTYPYPKPKSTHKMTTRVCSTNEELGSIQLVEVRPSNVQSNRPTKIAKQESTSAATCSSVVGDYQDFITMSLAAISSRISAILRICNDDRQEWIAIQTALDKSESYVRESEFTEARFKLDVVLPQVETLSKKKATDPFLQACFTAVGRDFKAVRQNGFDKLIKISKSGQGLPVCFSNIMSDHKKFMKMTPEALKEYVHSIGDTQLFDIINEIYDFLYYERAHHYDSPDLLMCDEVHSDHPSWCIYCRLHIVHCTEAPATYQSCCMDDTCVANLSIPEMFTLLDTLKLTPQTVSLIQVFKFAQLAAEAHFQRYVYTFDFPHQGDKAFDYPIMRTQNLKAFRTQSLDGEKQCPGCSDCETDYSSSEDKADKLG